METEEMELTTATDFSHLKEEPLKNQLEALFGAVEADQFLNPTIQDKRVKNIIPSNISNKIGPIGAEELWESLRNQSQQKLVQSPPASHVYLRRSNLTDDQKVERKVIAYRQKLQLMHRYAKLNDSKSKKLIHKVNLPKITGDWNANSTSSEKGNSSAVSLTVDCCDSILPQIQLDLDATSSCERTKSKNSNLQKETLLPENSDGNHTKVDVMIGNKSRNICFLSEKDLMFPGKFRERMKHHGVVSSVGISNASHFYNKQGRNISRSETSQSGIRNNDLKENRSQSSKSTTVWHPLTMNAVIECVDRFSSNKKLTCVW